MAGVSPETLRRILDQHTAALVLYARQWCSTPEDVVQDVFLLLMLCTRAAPNVVISGEEPEVAAPGIAGGKAAAEPSAPASAVAAEPPVDRNLEAVAAWLSQWSAREPSAGRGPESTDPAYSPSYPQLREQFLRHGAGSYPLEAMASAAATPVAGEPLPYCELLDRLLKKQTSGGSQRYAPAGID
jgi:hypothetical protein